MGKVMATTSKRIQDDVRNDGKDNLEVFKERMSGNLSALDGRKVNYLSADRARREITNISKIPRIR